MTRSAHRTNRRIALLVNGDFVTDTRTRKMATSLAEAGYRVTVVARASQGTAAQERDGDIEVIRVSQPMPLRHLPRVRLPGAEHPEAGRSDHEVPGAALVAATIGRAAQAARYLTLVRAWADAIARVVGPIDAWQAEELVMLPVALRLQRLRGGLVIHDARDLDLASSGFARLPGPWRALLAARERRWVRSADAVLAASEPYAAVLAAAWGRTPTVVWNGPAVVLDAAERGHLWHEQLHLPPDRRVVLHLGLAIPGRGIPELCRAMAAVPDATLVVAGFGPEYDHYRALAAELPHADRIAFPGPVRPEAIVAATAAADVAAMPVQGDTLNHRLNTPTKLFDAMGTGTPVVAGDLPGLSAIVRATGCGELCDPDDPDDIARALRCVLDASPERRQRYREAGITAARDVYAWDRQAVTYLNTIDALPWLRLG